MAEQIEDIAIPSDILASIINVSGNWALSIASIPTTSTDEYSEKRKLICEEYEAVFSFLVIHIEEYLPKIEKR